MHSQQIDALKLEPEILNWIRDGLISPAQGQHILSRYSPASGTSERSSRGQKLLLVLAAGLFGLAAIVFIGHNWEDYSRTTRLFALLVSTAFANLAGLYFFSREKSGAATAWFFAGSLLYGASIMLIGQMYHLGTQYAAGIFWWGVGIVPMALLTRSRALMSLALVLGITWANVVGGYGDMPVEFLLFAAAATVFLMCRKDSRVVFMLTITGLVVTIEYAVSAFMFGRGGYFDFGVENVMLGAGIALLLKSLADFLFVQSSGPVSRYGHILDSWLQRIFVLILLISTYSWPLKRVLRATWEYPDAFRTGAVAVIVVSLVLWWGAAKRNERFGWAVPALGLSFLAAIMYLTSGANFLDIAHLQIAMVAITLAIGISMIVVGINRAQPGRYFSGVVTILLIAVTRYFDLVENYVVASLLFVICALAMLGAASYWKRTTARLGEQQ